MDDFDDIVDGIDDNQRLQDDYFTNVSKIPLLRFEYDEKELLRTLTSLLHYATITATDKNFKKYELYQDKLKVYLMKIEEGLRQGKSLNGNDYYKSELERIEQKAYSLNNLLHSKMPKAIFWRAVKYISIAILIIVIVQKCRR